MRRSEAGVLSKALRARGVDKARVALVLGSGLGMFSERLEAAEEVPYDELEGMPGSKVPGHAGRLVLGHIEGVCVVALSGRVHRYEGWSVEEVTRAVRALASIGVRALLLTNAAGGVIDSWKPPLLMRVTDHIDLQATRLPSEITSCFPKEGLHEREDCASITPELQEEAALHRRASKPEDQNSSPYDMKLGRAIELAAREVGIPIVHGIYAGLLGPTYETPAEIRMLRWMGVSAVGMSTVAEATAARASGMRVAAISCITNPAAGVTSAKLTHEEVVAAGAQVSEEFCALLTAAVPRIAAELG